MDRQPNKEVKCFKCQKSITVKYNYPRKRYSERNSWGYWTEKEDNKEKHICNKCILNFYQKDKYNYLQSVQSLKKRENMRTFIYTLKRE